jgi:hypothetical protein
MTQSGIALLIVTAFVAGCVAAKLIIPPAMAQPVPRWDYFCTTVEPGAFGGARTWAAAIETISKKAGSEGWELITSDASKVLCFKRPMP